MSHSIRPLHTRLPEPSVEKRPHYEKLLVKKYKSAILLLTLPNTAVMKTQALIKRKYKSIEVELRHLGV